MYSVVLLQFANFAKTAYTRLMSNTKKPATKETTKEIEKTTPNNTQNTPKVENCIEVVAEKPASLSENTSLSYEYRVRNKRAYKIFLRLIKENKYTSAYATAKILNIAPQTIAKWLQTKPAINALEQKVSDYVSKIEASPDWKAQAYLMDKIMPNEEKQNTAIQIIMPTLQDTSGQQLAL